MFRRTGTSGKWVARIFHRPAVQHRAHDCIPAPRASRKAKQSVQRRSARSLARSLSEIVSSPKIPPYYLINNLYAVPARARPPRWCVQRNRAITKRRESERFPALNIAERREHRANKSLALVRALLHDRERERKRETT